MARFKLASFKTCPWVQRAAIVLKEKTVPYDIVYIDRDDRPDWFRAVSPHNKVPVLVIDETQALFESNAIAEYLDETVAPRLHPEDPIRRAQNRAWTDFVPSFSGAVSNCAYADSEAAFEEKKEKIPGPFGKLEEALARRGDDGPFFNGRDFSLVDAAYAPFLQRFTYLDRLRPVGIIERFPHLAAWRDALMARPSVRASTVADFEGVWQAYLIERGRWLGSLVGRAGTAAAE